MKQSNRSGLKLLSEDEVLDEVKRRRAGGMIMSNEKIKQYLASIVQDLEFILNKLVKIADIVSAEEAKEIDQEILDRNKEKSNEKND